MYRTICTELWTDPKVKALSTDGKCLFIYLITNPHTHMSGIYYCPASFMAEELKLSVKRINTLLDTLSIGDLAWFDKTTSTVFVVNMFAYQGKGAKNYACAASHLATLHASSLIRRFIDQYPDVSSYGIDTLSIGDTVLTVPVPVPVPVPDSDSDSEDGESEGKMIAWIVGQWGMISGVKPVRKVGKDLRKRLRTSLQVHTERDWWVNMFARVGQSDFLCGRANTFAASLDWILGPKNFEKFEAGNYDNRQGGVSRMMQNFVARGEEMA